MITGNYRPSFETPYLTAKEVSDACHQHQYLIFRFWAGGEIGINGKIVNYAKRKREVRDSDKTRFVSFRACDFLEYIQYKRPFC